MVAVILFYVIWYLSSLLTHFTQMTDKIEYDNDFQSRLPCWDLKRERFLIHYWFPENHILQGIRIVSFVSYSNFLISNNSFLLTIGQRSSKAVPVQWDFCNKATGSRVLLRGNPKPTGYPISHHRNSSAHVSRIDVGIQLCKERGHHCGDRKYMPLLPNSCRQTLLLGWVLFSLSYAIPDTQELFFILKQWGRTTWLDDLCGSLPNQNIIWLYYYLRSFKAEKNLRQTFLKFTLL